MTAALRSKLASRGYWQVVIRPTIYDVKLIEYRRLEPIVLASRVQLRGWDFPHIWKEPLNYHDESISQAGEWMNYVEEWQFFRSGLFVFLAALHLDWLDQADHLGQWREALYSGVTPGAAFGVFEAIHRMTDVIEFAARLALQEELLASKQLFVEVKAVNLANRSLRFENQGGWPAPRRVTKMAEYVSSEPVYARDDLVSRSQELALAEASRLFERFGWNADRAALQNYAAAR